MKTQNQKPNSRASFLSIDDWQDDEPVTFSWFDNPFVGMATVVGLFACLASLSMISWQAQANRQNQAREEADAALREIESLHQPDEPITNLDEALARLSKNLRPEGRRSALAPSLQYLANRANYDPSAKTAVQNKIMKWLETDSTDLQGNMDVFSIWFDAEDSRRISALIKKRPGYEHSLVEAMSNLPNPVPALISELSKHPSTGIAFHSIQQELRNHNIQPAEITRQLANNLRSAASPRDFEGIVLALNSMQWQIRSDEELKKEVASAMAAAGRDLTPDQLNKMHWNVPTAIKAFAHLPESSALLEKLGTTNDGPRNPQMSFGSRKNQNEIQQFQDQRSSDKSAVLLARQNKIHPRELLTYEDSELVQEFLWEGKLKGKSEFQNLNMSLNAASMKGFSEAGVSFMRSDGYSAINPLLTVVQKHSDQMTRERLSDKFLQKLDILLVNKLKEDLRVSSKANSRKPPGQRKMPDSLVLAELLGGKNAALAIAQAGKKKPEVLREFKGMLGALITLNEPETYGMIVNAWVIHGNADGLKNTGEEIEPLFIKRLEYKLKKLNAADKGQRRVIHFLMGALKEIGTTKSIPILTELTKSKVAGFRKVSQQTIDIIRQRSGER